MTDTLGDRMKRYEDTFRHHLPNHLPVIIRVDGKSFHTLTKKADKPFDKHIEYLMEATAYALCQQVQTAQIAYAQSDEISLLLHPYKRLTSQPWFDNNIQKMVSVAASIATAAFNQNAQIRKRWPGFAENFEAELPALFDARAYVLPECEVVNYFIWRQQDAMRNSVSMLAQSLFPHPYKELVGKNSKQLREMIIEKGKDWNALPITQQRGRCIRKDIVTHDGQTFRSHWIVDDEIPLFTENRDYIQKYVGHQEEDENAK